MPKLRKQLIPPIMSNLALEPGIIRENPTTLPKVCFIWVLRKDTKRDKSKAVSVNPCCNLLHCNGWQSYCTRITALTFGHPRRPFPRYATEFNISSISVHWAPGSEPCSKTGREQFMPKSITSPFVSSPASSKDGCAENWSTNLYTPQLSLGHIYRVKLLLELSAALITSHWSTIAWNGLSADVHKLPVPLKVL